MITYEKYAEIRDSKGLTDGKIAEMAGFGRSTFSDWKSGRSIPKIDKMQKIAEALGMDYFEFVGPVGKYSSLNPNKPQAFPEAAYFENSTDVSPHTYIEGADQEYLKKAVDLYELYQKSIPEIRSAVDGLLKADQSDS